MNNNNINTRSNFPHVNYQNQISSYNSNDLNDFGQSNNLINLMRNMSLEPSNLSINNLSSFSQPLRPLGSFHEVRNPINLNLQNYLALEGNQFLNLGNNRNINSNLRDLQCNLNQINLRNNFPHVNYQNQITSYNSNDLNDFGQSNNLMNLMRNMSLEPSNLSINNLSYFNEPLYPLASFQEARNPMNSNLQNYLPLEGNQFHNFGERSINNNLRDIQRNIVQRNLGNKIPNPQSPIPNPQSPNIFKILKII